ncbi:MAG TPA: hypothetical protein VLA19_25110, partial [Herpetosiphonaceae bacterium]|nr:hypothetical protein [Herpetosiphonaceae bacterium]
AATEPTPGQFYPIQPGDRLVALARAAYPDLHPLDGARRINNHRYNRRLWRPPGDSSSRWFPGGVISFAPRFRSVRRQGLMRRREPRDGRSYALIYVPRP